MESDHVDALIARWHDERPELDTRMIAVSARVLRLQHFLDRRLAQALAPHELHPGEANVLAALRRAGAPFQLTPTQLSRSLLVSSGAMTNRLDRLQARELIERIPDHEDGRRTRVALTPAGRVLIDAAMQAWVVSLEEQLGFLADDERSSLEQLLRRVLVELERQPTTT
jgi:DNA-binding MarR family transcriptional regulator